MFRKHVGLAVIAAIAGVGVFRFITIPAVVPASALPAYTPDLDNGQTTFNAGGCSSCHAVLKGASRRTEIRRAAPGRSGAARPCAKRA
jgi:hypothetical protein